MTRFNGTVNAVSELIGLLPVWTSSEQEKGQAVLPVAGVIFQWTVIPRPKSVYLWEQLPESDTTPFTIVQAMSPSGTKLELVDSNLPLPLPVSAIVSV